MNMWKNVHIFMRDSEQILDDELTPATVEHQELYKKLMAEEYREFVDGEGDEVEEIDACMDLIWVTLGYCIAKGWDTHGAWREVMRTNMEKLQIDPETGKIKRRPDGKILKPADWKAPDLTPFVRNKGV